LTFNLWDIKEYKYNLVRSKRCYCTIVLVVVSELPPPQTNNNNKNNNKKNNNNKNNNNNDNNNNNNMSLNLSNFSHQRRAIMRLEICI